MTAAAIVGIALAAAWLAGGAVVAAARERHRRQQYLNGLLWRAHVREWAEASARRRARAMRREALEMLQAAALEGQR